MLAGVLHAFLGAGQAGDPAQLAGYRDIGAVAQHQRCRQTAQVGAITASLDAAIMPGIALAQADRGTVLAGIGTTAVSGNVIEIVIRF